MSINKKPQRRAEVTLGQSIDIHQILVSFGWWSMNFARQLLLQKWSGNSNILSFSRISSIGLKLSPRDRLQKSHVNVGFWCIMR